SPQARKQLRSQQAQAAEATGAADSPISEPTAPQSPETEGQDLAEQPSEGETGQADPENSELNDAR
ncbi:MAG: hypothetical protein E7I00_08275, partial [Varibaculum cambriense]|nr:hypothetical protein [Varibaculum cambriense]